MKARLLIILTLLITLSLVAQKKIKINGEQEIIYPFETNSKTMFFDWLNNNQDFNEIEIFAMGEATHGTKDFFDIKVNTFKYLVENHNFKVFGIEASYGECNYINDYIQSGEGNIDTIMTYFNFWTWRTEEVKNLILWMKEFNQKNEEKLNFYGFDMQSVSEPIKYLAHFFRNDTSNYVQELNKILAPVRSKSEKELGKVYKDGNLKFKDTLNVVSTDLKIWFSNYEDALIDNYSIEKLKKLKLNLTTYNQSLDYYSKGVKHRDSCMASNVVEIQKMENEKMFLWAHNGHVNKSSSKYSQIKWMGEYIYEQLKFKYYAVGFVFSKGSFQSYVSRKGSNYKFKVSTLSKYRNNTFTKPLYNLNEEQFFIDLRKSNNSLFTNLNKAYRIGSVFINKRKSSFPIIAKKQFDGIIYVRNTVSATPVENND